MVFCEEFYNDNVFYRLRVCNKVNMGVLPRVSYINFLKVYKGGYSVRYPIAILLDS